MNEMQLYIHYPFCAQKCRYCDFLSAPATETTKKVYMNALIHEISKQSFKYREDTIKTIFIGGGTPSVMAPEDLTRLMGSLRNDFKVCLDAEITLEANPGTLTGEFLDALVESGVNRLSLGLQSAHNHELKLLGRIHTFEQFSQNYEAARCAGIQNINVDLMSALPGQTMELWEETLNKVIALKPEHISAYSLIIEEGTPFYDIYGNDTAALDALPLPDEDMDRHMYEQTKIILDKAGYDRYEISNYARPGYECRHNKGYWQRVNYLGLGLGAASLINGQRFSNTHDISEYMENYGPDEAARECYIEETVLTVDEQMEEFMFLGLRLTEGIHTTDFEKCFGVNLFTVYGDVIQMLLSKGLIKYIEERKKLFLTEHGIDISNYVLSYFLK